MHSIWHSITLSQIKLDYVRYKAMRICCGAMTGTSATSLQCECGQPPLCLRWQRMLIEDSLKIKSVPSSSSNYTRRLLAKSQWKIQTRKRAVQSESQQNSSISRYRERTITPERHGAMGADHNNATPSKATQRTNTPSHIRQNGKKHMTMIMTLETFITRYTR